MSQIVVIYHDDADGIVSMYAAWCQFRDTAKYNKINYGDPFPYPLDRLTNDTEIYVLDFCFDRKTLLDVNERVKKLIIIDHHDKTEKTVNDLPFVTCDKNHSGCVLSWKHFFPNITIPELFTYVDDYDRCVHKTKYSYAIDILFSTHQDRYNPFFIDKLANEKDFFDLIMRIPMIKSKADDEYCEAFLKDVTKYKIINLFGYKVAVYNTTVLKDRVAEKLYTCLPEIDFTLSYRFDGHGKMSLDFRCSKEKGLNLNLSEIATKFGGGGHQTAAGASLFGTNIPAFLETVGII